jgi:hypothetical protein
VSATTNTALKRASRLPATEAAAPSNRRKARSGSRARGSSANHASGNATHANQIQGQPVTIERPANGGSSAASRGPSSVGGRIVTAAAVAA